MRAGTSWIIVVGAVVWSAGLATADGTMSSPVIISSKSCSGRAYPHPLKSEPSPFSPFNAARHHFGTDYASKDEDVHAIAAGKITKIGWDARSLKSPNARSGLSVQGWGRYVLIHHDDGSESLYAHLEQDSTKALKVGQVVQTVDVLGKTDTTGGATGPHLHFEYSPQGDIFDRTSKVDPDQCVLRTGMLSMDTTFRDANGIFQIFIDGQLVGENSPGSPTRLSILIKPGAYRIRAIAKQVQKYKEATVLIELSDHLTILDKHGADLGPELDGTLQPGKFVEATLQVN